jgi:hypothetical protein
MTRDAKHPTLESHDIGEQCDMPDVNLHTMRIHGCIDLVYDGIPSSFDTQNFLYLDDMICLCIGVINAWRQHHLLEAIALHQQFELFFVIPCILFLRFIFLLFIDNGSIDRRNASDDHIGQHIFQSLHHKIHFLPRLVIRLDVQLGLVPLCNVVWLELHIPRFQDGMPDLVNVAANSESGHGFQVQLYREVALLRRVHFFDVFAHFAEGCLLEPTLDNSRRPFVIFSD